MTTDIQGSNSFVGHLQLLVHTAMASSIGAEAGWHNLLYSNAPQYSRFSRNLLHPSAPASPHTHGKRNRRRLIKEL